MTLTILVSFSLLALVVTARPILPQDTSKPDDQSIDIHNAVQAIFQSRTGYLPEDLNRGDHEIRIHLTSSEDQEVYLSHLADPDAIKAIVPLGDALSDSEKELYSIISNGKNGDSLDDLDGGERPLSEFEPAAEPADAPEADVVEQATIESSTPTRTLVLPPLLVLTFSCIAAFVTLVCVGAFLYVVHLVRSDVFESELGWGPVPAKEKLDGNDGDGDSEEKEALLSVGEILTDRRREAQRTPDGDSQASEDLSTDNEDINEKFHDAEETPLIIFAPQPSHSAPGQQRPLHIVEDFDDPDLLPLPRSPTPFLTPSHTPAASPTASPLRRPIQMREVPVVSPVSKPAWSLRAADSPSFALPGSSTRRSSSPQIPGTLPPDPPSSADAAVERNTVERHGGRRAYRTPVPELDIAFALQLRPGLGLGADSAWLVRFLMAMFGWMSVLFGGGGYQRERQQQRALM